MDECIVNVWLTLGLKFSWFPNRLSKLFYLAYFDFKSVWVGGNLPVGTEGDGHEQVYWHQDFILSLQSPLPSIFQSVLSLAQLSPDFMSNFMVNLREFKLIFLFINFRYLRKNCWSFKKDALLLFLIILNYPLKDIH